MNVTLSPVVKPTWWTKPAPETILARKIWSVPTTRAGCNFHARKTISVCMTISDWIHPHADSCMESLGAKRMAYRLQSLVVDPLIDWTVIDDTPTKDMFTISGLNYFTQRACELTLQTLVPIDVQENFSDCGYDKCIAVARQALIEQLTNDPLNSQKSGILMKWVVTDETD